MRTSSRVPSTAGGLERGLTANGGTTYLIKINVFAVDRNYKG